MIQGRSAARWPGWAEDPELAIASAYVPLEWERVTGVAEPAEAALPLAAALLEAPERAARELAAPCVIAIADKRAEKITIVNDALAAGRLFEARGDGIRVWSNRLGALCVVAEIEPVADAKSWSLFAAIGWFPLGRTPIRGTSPLAGGSIVEIGADRVARRSTPALADLAAGAPDGEDTAAAFTQEAIARARSLARLYDEPPRVDLSGGRDSRVAAAVVVAAGIEASFRTSDLTPGEADVARELVGLVPGEVEHSIQWAGHSRKRTPGSPLERARAVHLVHDGMRHAAKIRAKMTLPRPQPPGATVSGHGGAVAKGSMYSPGKLARLEAGGLEVMLEILAQSMRRSHSAASEGAYELALDQLESELALGASAGLDGASLLDWYHLIERFPRRGALATDAAAFTFFSSPVFIRAALMMAPEERIASRLHRDAIRLLVPAWADVPFFKRGRAHRGLVGRLLRRGEVRRVDVKREPIWAGEDGEEVRGLVEQGGAWTAMFEPESVARLIAEIDAGRSHPHYQDVLEAIVYREAFEQHLDRLATAMEPARK